MELRILGDQPVSAPRIRIPRYLASEKIPRGVTTEQLGSHPQASLAQALSPVHPKNGRSVFHTRTEVTKSLSIAMHFLAVQPAGTHARG